MAAPGWATARSLAEGCRTKKGWAGMRLAPRPKLRIVLHGLGAHADALEFALTACARQRRRVRRTETLCAREPAAGGAGSTLSSGVRQDCGGAIPVAPRAAQPGHSMNKAEAIATLKARLPRAGSDAEQLRQGGSLERYLESRFLVGFLEAFP